MCSRLHDMKSGIHRLDIPDDFEVEIGDELMLSSELVPDSFETRDSTNMVPHA